MPRQNLRPGSRGRLRGRRGVIALLGFALVLGVAADRVTAQQGRGQGAGQTAAPGAGQPGAAAGRGQAEPGPVPDPVVSAQTPTFRGGITFVRVDVIVSDRNARPVTDLTQADFEVLEDGKVQAIEQFRLVRVDGNLAPNEAAPRVLRNRDDEEREAQRDDTRVFAFLLDDYHVRRANSISIRDTLTRFIQTQLRPNDIVTVMAPLTPVTELSFTRDHQSVINAIQRFEGRKFDYRPLNQFEETYQRYPTETVERIRNDVVMGALRGLSVRLGSLRDGRKSVIFVSEGFTAFLPPQMRRGDASMPENPLISAVAAAGQDSSMEQTAAWFGQSDILQRMRDVISLANRNNAAIYSLDPRGLAPFEYDINDSVGGMVSFATDRRAMQLTQDTLRTLSEETDGRAIVNRNSLGEGLNQIVRDSSYYYLLGYNTQAPTDGKFHQITVRVKRKDIDVRARRGYWAATVADSVRAATPTPAIARPVETALATIAPSVQAGKYVRTWIGTERGGAGKTRVTLIWEPLTQGASARREEAGRMQVLAATMKGDLLYRGRTPDAVAGPATASNGRPGAGGAPAAPANVPVSHRLTFELPPGQTELRLTVEGASGGTLDQEIRTIDVPDLTAPQAALSTPRVHRARTARELQALAQDGSATPTAAREFSRTERLLIRFDVYAAGTETPAPTAALLNRSGQKMADVPVAPAVAGGTHQIDLGLNTIAAGEYLVEIRVKGQADEASLLVPFRVGA